MSERDEESVLLVIENLQLTDTPQPNHLQAGGLYDEIQLAIDSKTTVKTEVTKKLLNRFITD